MPDNVAVINKRKPKRVLIYFLMAISIILLGTTGYFFYQYQKLMHSPIASQRSAEEEAQRLVTKVGKLMLLPKDEIPTVITVTDITKLNDQPFFKNAKNGNKVLIYPNSKQAILYDPGENIIVNVGPVNFAEQPAPSPQKIQIGLRNGTNVVGLTHKLEADIKKSYPNVDIVLKDQDKRTDFEKTIVVVFNEASKDIAADLSKTLNAQVDKLPDGEVKPPGVDILIIVGKDKS